LGLYQADEKVIEARIKDCIEMVRLGMAGGGHLPVSPPQRA
jgi:hypothetical protein